MRVWSVELEAAGFNDNTFTGGFNACVDYCMENGYKIDGEEAQLADIEVDRNGAFKFCYNIVKSEGDLLERRKRE